MGSDCDMSIQDILKKSTEDSREILKLFLFFSEGEISSLHVLDFPFFRATFQHEFRVRSLRHCLESRTGFKCIKKNV